MRKKLKKYGHSLGIVFPREVLNALGVKDEIDFQIVGNTVLISAPDADVADLEDALQYLASQRRRRTSTHRGPE